jgi:alanine-glyoxylate transaminase/serine-glyoxylate transaminase/serine-pyruvate transaminase
MDAWQIDLCVTASQKALGAPPGLCLVAVNPRCWPVLDERSAGPGYYLNLSNWRKRAAESGHWHPSLSTMAVPSFLALRQAIHLALEEGLEARFARHRRISLLVRQAVRSLGLETYVADEVASPTVTTILLPEGFEAQQVRETMAQKHDIMIGGASIPGGERAVRIGHMGPQATLGHVVPTLVALEDSLRVGGWAARPGQVLAGVDAALLS